MTGAALLTVLVLTAVVCLVCDWARTRTDRQDAAEARDDWMAVADAVQDDAPAGLRVINGGQR